MTYEYETDYAVDVARIAGGESYSPPYPANAVKIETRVREWESEPIFATHKLTWACRPDADTQRLLPIEESSSSPNSP